MFGYVGWMTSCCKFKTDQWYLVTWSCHFPDVRWLEQKHWGQSAILDSRISIWQDPLQPDAHRRYVRSLCRNSSMKFGCLLDLKTDITFLLLPGPVRFNSPTSPRIDWTLVVYYWAFWYPTYIYGVSQRFVTVVFLRAKTPKFANISRAFRAPGPIAERCGVAVFFGVGILLIRLRWYPPATWLIYWYPTKREVGKIIDKRVHWDGTC